MYGESPFILQFNHINSTVLTLMTVGRVRDSSISLPYLTLVRLACCVVFVRRAIYVLSLHFTCIFIIRLIIYCISVLTTFLNGYLYLVQRVPSGYIHRVSSDFLSNSQ